MLLRREVGKVLFSICVFKETDDGYCFLSEDIEVAAKPHERMKGLLGAESISRFYGMLFFPARSIHTFFMRFPIGIICVDRQGVVTNTVSKVEPNRIKIFRNGTYAVFETNHYASGFRCVEKGEKLFFKEKSERCSIKPLGELFQRSFFKSIR